MGMCMDRHGSTASALMTSTWHRVNGPMAGLMDRAAAGEFPLFTFCAFEVLEHCPEDRSGPKVGGEACYANCPQCPLKPWCHAERDRNGDVPLAKRSNGHDGAKRSNGHYEIDSLIQKVRSTSARTFESDYLCKGPRRTGSGSRRSTPRPTHVSRGRNTIRTCPSISRSTRESSPGRSSSRSRGEQTPTGPVEEVRVFADYLAENLPAEQNARAILEVARARCEAGSTRSRPTRRAARGTRSGRRSSPNTSGSDCARCGAGRSARWPTAWPWSSRSSTRPTAGPG